MLIQPDNKIVVGGSDISGNYFFVARYMPDGNIDASFGSKGEVFTSFGKDIPGIQINSLALDTKQRIVAAGIINYYKKGEVVRYLPDGSPDNSFNDGSTLELPFEGVAYAYTNTVLAQSDNKLIVSSIISDNGNKWKLALTGLNEDGSLDASFGTDKGQTIISTNINDIENTTSIMQTDGKVIVSGDSYDDQTNQNTYILTRFNGYPTQVPLFVRIKRWLQNHGISWKGLPKEDNIAYYTIEQSGDGRTDFTPIAKVNGRSNLKDYNYTNSKLLQGSNYYRIKAVSTHGTIRYSEVASAANNAVSAAASIYPNPVRGYVQVQGLQVNEKASITIANSSGTVLASGTSSGTTQYRAPATKLMPGTYYLHITTTNKTETIPFVKE